MTQIKSLKAAKRAFLRHVYDIATRTYTEETINQIFARTYLQAMGILPYKEGQATIFTLHKSELFPKPWDATEYDSRLSKDDTTRFTIFAKNDRIVADNLKKAQVSALNWVSQYIEGEIDALSTPTPVVE